MFRPQKYSPFLQSLFIQCSWFCKTSQTYSDQNSIMKILNVAEKNDAAKNIANHLSRGTCQRSDGLSKYNKIYSFNYNFRGQNVEMVMTSVSGHLMAFEFGGQYRNWRGCNPLVLFDVPVYKLCPKKYEDIKKTIEIQVRSCQMLIIWTDCDREGENIGFEIIEICQAVKPNIQVYRAKFSEITSQSIQRAMNSLEAPNKLLSDAVNVRSELDLRIGASFTRFQTMRLQQVFPQRLSDQLISYGSCQFPTLGFVVERYKAIERFIPESFWKITVSHAVDSVNVKFSWKRVRLFDELACQVLFDTVQEQSEAVVEKVVNKPKSKWRPLPLDTIELEKLGSRKLKISAKETMLIAERLYTQGLISYPRTETNIFPNNMDLSNLVQQQTEDDRWGAFAQTVLQDRPNPRQGRKSDQAHPPIHPTKYKAPLHGNDGRVYEFIVRHFLACCSKDAEGHETVVDIDINGEKFVASGLQIIARNYLDVYPYENWKAKEIHSYEEGQRFQPTEIDMGHGETDAPNLLTEADLIALMEKHGIGTDATHADHIETIKTRNYVGLQDTYFLPGELGLGLVEGYDSMGFAMSKPNLRAELEADLQRIADGIRNPNEVLAEQIGNYKRVFQQALEQASKIDIALAEYLNEERRPATEIAGGHLEMNFKKVCACPSCGQDMILKPRPNNAGFYVACMGFPECRSSIWFPNSVEHVDVSEQVCENCEMRPCKIIFRFSRGMFLPHYPDHYEGCVGGCDRNLMELLGIRPLRDLANRNAHMPRGDNVQANHRNNRVSDDSGFGSSSNSSINRSVSRGAGENTTRTRGNASNTGSRPIQRSQTAVLPGGDAICCRCNLDAIQLTVRKEGPNQGRLFYKCGNNSSCDFFLWADDRDAPPRANGNQGSSHQIPRSNFNHVNNGFDDNGGGGEVVCSCGQPAKSLSVQKDGPNKGRAFFVCDKPRDSQCTFFQWADSTGDSSAGRGGWNGRGGGQGGGGGGRVGRGGSGRGRGRGGGNSWAGGGNGSGGSGNNAKGKRKCGNCGQEGHFKPKCPNV